MEEQFKYWTIVKIDNGSHLTSKKIYNTLGYLKGNRYPTYRDVKNFFYKEINEFNKIMECSDKFSISIIDIEPFKSTGIYVGVLR